MLEDTDCRRVIADRETRGAAPDDTLRMEDEEEAVGTAAADDFEEDGARAEAAAREVGPVTRHVTQWVEKYRPRRIDDVAHQEHIKQVLRGVVASRNMPHCIFHGPPGTGKTSAALALCRELFPTSEMFAADVIEFNASHDRGINVVRQRIKQFVRQRTATMRRSSWKVIILDEADRMTGDAQTALRRLMEDYAATSRFIFICNYVSKIIDPVASRCAKFRFEQISREAQLEKLAHIAKAECLILEKTVMEEIIDITDGDLRGAVVLLQSAAQAAVVPRRPTINEVRAVAGEPPADLGSQILARIARAKAANGSTGKENAAPRDLQLNSLTSIVYAIKEELRRESWDLRKVLQQLLSVIVDVDQTGPFAPFSDVAKARIAFSLAQADSRLVAGVRPSCEVLAVLHTIAHEVDVAG